MYALFNFYFSREGDKVIKADGKRSRLGAKSLEEA